MNEIQEISIDLLEDNPYDQRKKYGDIEGLAHSISQRHLQNPISVVKVNDRFVIVSGHRRVHAYRYLHEKKIPAIVRKESTPTNLMLDLAVENLQRKDLLPAERGATLKQLFFTIPSVENNTTRALALINQVKIYAKRNKIGGGFTEEDIVEAKKFLDLLGISTSAATTYVRLCSLPEEIQRTVISASNVKTIPDKKISVKSAYELTRINDADTQKQLYDKVIKDKIKHTELKHMVDKLVEENDTIARKSITGSAERRTEDDVGAAKLTKDILALSSRVSGFHSKLPLICGRLEKVEWAASLDKMKRTCLDMVQNINSLLREDLKIEELLTYVNADLEVNVSNTFRYTIPINTVETLGIKEGDTLLLKIEGIKRSRMVAN